MYPGQGAAGPPSTLYEDERIYLGTCRAIAAEEIARSGFTEAAKRAAMERINACFPYVNPTGVKDIIRSSVHGLLQELSMPNDALRASESRRIFVVPSACARPDRASSSDRDGPLCCGSAISSFSASSQSATGSASIERSSDRKCARVLVQ